MGFQPIRNNLQNFVNYLRQKGVDANQLGLLISQATTDGVADNFSRTDYQTLVALSKDTRTQERSVALALLENLAIHSNRYVCEHDPVLPEGVDRLLWTIYFTTTDTNLDWVQVCYTPDGTVSIDIGVTSEHYNKGLPFGGKLWIRTAEDNAGFQMENEWVSGGFIDSWQPVLPQKSGYTNSILVAVVEANQETGRMEEIPMSRNRRNGQSPGFTRHPFRFEILKTYQPNRAFKFVSTNMAFYRSSDLISYYLGKVTTAANSYMSLGSAKCQKAAFNSGTGTFEDSGLLSPNESREALSRLAHYLSLDFQPITPAAN